MGILPDKVVYSAIGVDQVSEFGDYINPKDILVDGQVYNVANIAIHSWHTRVWVYVKNAEVGPFNSVLFNPYVPPSDAPQTGSILQDWVTKLSLRHQGTLIVATRGCDTAPKYPLDSPERQLAGWIRYCTLNPADPREVDIPGSFWYNIPPSFKPSALGHYPLHWYTHVMHALEVIGTYHPDTVCNKPSRSLYLSMVASLHLEPESLDALEERLTEDRIANNSVLT